LRFPLRVGWLGCLRTRAMNPLGFEFPRVSGKSFRRGATNKNGRGQVRGGQPGTPSTPRKCATRLRYGPNELQIVSAFPAARKLELPPGCSSPRTYPHAIWDAAPRLRRMALPRRICGPHTRPSALRFPLRVGWLGCLRTRAMNPGPFHGRDGSPSRPIGLSRSRG